MSRISTLLIVVSLSVVTGIVFAVDAGDAKSRNDADKQLADVALKTYQQVLDRYPIDPDHRRLEEIYVWSKRAMDAEPGNKEAANAHLERMVDLEKFAIGLKEAKQIAHWEVTAATFYRAEAEILAAKLQRN